MTDALRKYLSGLPNTRVLSSTAIEGYRQEMASTVIPKNLRGSFEKRRIAAEAMARGPHKTAKSRKTDSD